MNAPVFFALAFIVNTLLWVVRRKRIHRTIVVMPPIYATMKTVISAAFAIFYVAVAWSSLHQDTLIILSRTAFTLYLINEAGWHLYVYRVKKERGGP